MNNVVQFKAPAKDPEGFSDFIDHLKDSAEQLIYIQKSKEGEIGLGHSELSRHDLIIMYYYIQKYIQYLLDAPMEIDEDEFTS